MSDDDRTVGGTIRGPSRDDMDAIWQALSERDAMASLCETWSSIAQDNFVDLEAERCRRKELEAGILEIIHSDAPSGMVRRALSRLLGGDGGS